MIAIAELVRTRDTSPLLARPMKITPSTASRIGTILVVKKFRMPSVLIVFGSGVGVGARAIASTARVAEPHNAWPISINIIRPPRRRDGRGARRALSLAEKTTLR